jgi:hypothetical protein
MAKSAAFAALSQISILACGTGVLCRRFFFKLLSQERQLPTPESANRVQMQGLQAKRFLPKW